MTLKIISLVLSCSALSINLFITSPILIKNYKNLKKYENKIKRRG